MTILQVKVQSGYILRDKRVYSSTWFQLEHQGSWPHHQRQRGRVSAVSVSFFRSPIRLSGVVLPVPTAVSFEPLAVEGNKLVRRDVDASELAGRPGRSPAAEVALGGCSEDRLFDASDATDDWADKRGLPNDCCEYGPGVVARRSRNERRECPVLVGVSSTLGDSDVDRPSGLRRVGSLVPPDPGVTEADRWESGEFLLYGLGVVRLSGLK
jgi:hypothetical protein